MSGNGSSPAASDKGSLKVEVKEAAKARAAGVNGALIALTDPAGTPSAAKLEVHIDPSAWANSAGANWADRARLVQLPTCALTTPGADGCTTRTPLASYRDATGRIVAEVDAPKPQTAPTSVLKSRPDTQHAPSAAPQVLAAQGVALAVEPGPSGPSGDYSATPLLPSASWQAGANAANFTYGYTAEIPSTIAGAAPSLVLGYDSSSIDGRTASTNAQSGPIGEGWGWSPGSISRTYKGCKDAGIKDSGDECWAGDILSLNLAGHAGQIVRDDTTCVYRLQGDDGTKIERLTDQRNSAWKGEGFKVTTTDGTQYYFGSNRLPGGDGTDPEAKSVSTVPVYFNSGRDKCLGAATPADGSYVQMGWQWNLDYVVDPHQNLTSYRYEQETNHYVRGGGQNNGNGAPVAYQRGSYPTWIGYGQRLPDQIAAKGSAKPASQILLGSLDRCFEAGDACDPAKRKTNAKAWADTPVDQECADAGQCLNLSPTYFTTKRLATIDTEVLDTTNATYRRVDSYTLDQSFADPGDGTAPTLWLNSIKRSATNNRTKQDVPPVTFQPLQIPNRVDGIVKRPDGTEASAPRFNRPRIQKITTETGGRVNVVYKAPECSRVKGTMPSSEDGNTMACMPVKWYLPGQSFPDPVNDWFNKIVVQSVTQQDMVAGQVTTVTDYEYGGGMAWHRNDSEFTDPKTRSWDQFRGYATVTTRTGSGNSAEAPRTKSVSTFLRGMDGDVLANGGKRNVTVPDAHGGTIKDEDVLSGFVRQTETFDRDGGSVIADEVTTPWLGGKITATRAQSGGMPAITARAMNTGKVTTRAKLANGTWRTSERSSTYDDTLFSRPLQVDDWSDTSRPDQRLCTTFDYATGPGGAITQLASRTLVLSGKCGQTPTTANTVGDTRAYFDSLPLGQAGATADQSGTEVLEKYDASGQPVYRLNVSSAYDTYGRITSTTNKVRKDATHPDGAVTKTEYKPATGGLPTSVTHTNPLGWKTVTTFDLGRSLPQKTTDENKHVAERAYDALGRIASVWQPGQVRQDDPPVRKFSYAMNGTNAPSTVVSQTLMSDNSYISSYTIYDGLGRVRQTQAHPPSGTVGRMVTDAVFDSHGWQVKTSAPYFNDEKGPGGALFLPNGGVNPDSKIPAQTVSVFDGLGRSTASIYQSFGIEQWRSKTEYPGADEVRTIPPNGGYAQASITNGTTSLLRQYKSNTPTGAYDETTYEANTQGQEVRRKDSAGNEWTFTYDLLGRTVKTTDPDSGAATTVYDDSKNLVTTTDSRGKSATTVSDLLGRSLATYEGTTADPAKQVGAFTYDTKVLGKPSISTRYVGGASGRAYTTEVTGYDSGYRPLGTKVTIPAFENQLAGTYETTNTYDKHGQLKTTDLPAITAAGLNSETLTYGTNVTGSFTSLDSTLGIANVPYVADMRYDPYGRAIRTTIGDAGRQIVSTVDYDQATGRPIRSTLDKQTATTASVDVVDYTYNRVGQLTSINNTQDGTARDLQCFTTDYLGRLTQAWTDTGATTTAPQPSVRGIGGCANATGPKADGAGKPSVGGPAPYWQQYEYDKLGNRTKLVKKDVTGNAAKDTTVTQTFGSGPNAPSSDPKTGGGTGGPHALMSSTETSQSGTKVTSYTYDAVGNTASITSTPGTRTLTWNDQGKLDKITGTGESAGTSYLYDTGGNQLIRRDPGKTTLNLGTDQITLDTATGKVSNVRTYGAPGGLSITRTTTAGTSALTYQASDHHGTNGVQFNATDLAQARRPADPFGNERGTQPAPGTWAGDKGFIGGTKEKATGFTLLGAREYDPTTGRFISPDPIIDPGDPQQWNAYAYANNTPLNASDPTGLKLGCDTAAECSNNKSDGLDKPYTYAPPPPTGGSSPEKQELDQANGELHQVKKKREELKHAVVDLVMDLIGYNDARDCFTKGDVMACVNTALNAVPWGKIFKAIKIGIKAFKIYKELNKTYEAINAAERRASQALGAYTKAKRADSEAAEAASKAAKSGDAKASKESASDSAGTESKAGKGEADAEAQGSGSDAKMKSDSCDVKTNSFPAGTGVQMADGTTRAIEDVRVGDTVMATDPQTGETRPKKVTATITTPDDKDFTDLTLTDDANPRGPPATLTSTFHHPYWSETRRQWTDAGALTSGEQLRQPNGTTLTVQTTRNYPHAVTTYNLTVDDFHTYYVLAGATPVLVHNCDGEVHWVPENAHMSPQAQAYDSGATGSRPGVAPALQYYKPTGSKLAQVKFDGFDAMNGVLIDRKLAVTHRNKTYQQALNQSQALEQNGYSGRWEVPDATEARRARKLLGDLLITNIRVRIVP
ncbi:polymorphic toxin-type HINT domain-containing protein [Streptomyces antarcticus]|uniref:polymorphic toxin-type HINT domain-containing protein n=1 Tax=Streptomyces antarcticus TaxID=2996458 RepID=UPI002271416E|nr:MULTISPECIES: polymorphic toxin-type HINT domain-containing protein [unclassified Streptomyces]MCY0940948.1 polymorphic toxin-type HINT domain-containing protein [Streptomyces sp. H34-AA3]MCZ4081287.1 polymorphic toxin-type HINT domain-containing protein [Streptomyces sp. H34-S5]